MPLYIISESTFGALCALASAFFWALTSMFVRRLGAVCSMMTINAVRISAAGVLVLLALPFTATAREEIAAMSATTLLLIASSTVLAAGIGDSIFFECSRVLGLGRAMTLAMTYPLMAAAFAAAFLGEPITVRTMGGTVLTLIGLGLIVVARPDGGGGSLRGHRLAILMSFVVAMTWAASAILMKPPMRELSPLTAQGIRMPIVALFLWFLPWARSGLPPFLAARRAVLVPMIVLSLLTAVSALTWVAGLKYSDVVVATVLSSTSPMFALGLGAMFLGERVTVGAVCGALLTIVGIVVLKV